MLFLNFLDTDNIAPANGFMGMVAGTGTYFERIENDLPLDVEVSMRVTGFGSLDLEKGEFIEGPGKNTILIYEGYDGWSDESPRTLFNCDEERAYKINKHSRNLAEDTVIALEKVRFLRGIPAYFSYMPMNKGMLICLHAGAMQVYVNGDWILYNLIAGGVSESVEKYEYTRDSLMEMTSAIDKKSKYNMVKDGIILVEALIDVKKDGKTVKMRSFIDHFQLLDETRVLKARENLELKKKADEEERKRKAEENKQALERDKLRRLAMEAEKAEKKKGKPTRKKKSSDSDDDTETTVSMSEGASLFSNMLSQSGYKR